MPATPASPPKRMTRARAKAVEQRAKTTTARATTASSRAAANTKSSNSKRKIPIEDETETHSTTTRASRKVSTKPTLAESQGRVPAVKPKTEISHSAAGTDCSEAAEAKPKGRPRKTAIAKDTTTTTTKAAGPATRTRARADTNSKTAGTGKKVAFRDPNEEKENATTVAGKAAIKTFKDSAVKPTKVTTTSSGSVKQNEQVKDSDDISNNTRTTPLSPKKDMQVAKGDNRAVHERSGGEAAASSDDPFITSSEGAESPTRHTMPMLLCSPARRAPPPASPFKDGKWESPRRIPLGRPPADTTLQRPLEMQSNMFAQSPRKLKVQSPLKDTKQDLSSEDHEGALFASPARRIVSPMKGLTSATPGLHQSPSKNSSGSILASRSPKKFNPVKNNAEEMKAVEVELMKARLASVEEQAAALQDELNSPPSPLSITKSATEAFPEIGGAVEAHFSSAETYIYPSGQHDVDDMDIDADEHCIPSSSKSAAPSKAEDFDLYGDDSEDELASDRIEHLSPAALRHRLSSHFNPPETPQTVAQTSAPESQQPQESLTALAQRFGQWKAATPDPIIMKHRQASRSVFSPLPQLARPCHDVTSATSSAAATPEPQHEESPSFFDEAMTIKIHEDEDVHMDETDDEADLMDQDTQDCFRQSQMSEASQVYGDENECPVDPTVLHLSASASQNPETCTPERIIGDQSRIIHTVSKVPLKGCDDTDLPSPAVSKRRTHSLAGHLSPQSNLELQAMRQFNPSAAAIDAEQHVAYGMATNSSGIDQMISGSSQTPQRIISGTFQGSSCSSATPRANAALLKGAVVFVDVHTTEGADASALFVDLLTQMGAKCVRSWNWNSRTSPVGEGDDAETTPYSNKIGITHVVFKDGGKRTMEKVREASGRVACVGVGWVLDCERFNQWLDEIDYAIDISLVPRGGSRRRKSMEPRSLSLCNGELFAATTPRKPSPPQTSPTKEFLNLSPPERRVSFAPTGGAMEPETPVSSRTMEQIGNVFDTPTNTYEESSLGSPTTPYFLHPTQLVQQTCPPKQSQELFFPVSGRIDDQPNEAMRARLVLARRKSLQFAPKVGSPLSKRDHE